jgi:hypothetical protein
MGYLAILAGVFVGGLVINAMFWGLLSHWLYGSVQDWVLGVSLVLAGLTAYASAETFDRSTCGAPR